MDKLKLFMDTFQTLESFLRVEYEQGMYRESTFMGTLFRVRGKKANKIIANPKYFIILQQAAQLRNIIVHNTEVAEPTDVFLDKFVRIVEMIVHPQKVMEAMIPLAKIQRVSPHENIGITMDMMDKYGFSKIPVFENDRLIGVFTEKAFYYHLSTNVTGTISRKMQISELMKAIDLDGNPARYFAFIPRNMDIYEAIQMFRRDFLAKNKLEMLFVTENGVKGEKILGILTLPDLENKISF